MTLYCNGTGNPTPNIAWIHSGEVLSINRPYVISAINRSQAGLYECMAWNGIASNATTNCTVDVQCKLIIFVYFALTIWCPV